MEAHNRPDLSFSTTLDIYSQRQNAPPVSRRLGTAYVCFKIILLLANLVFLIFACALIGLGSYALNSSANSIAGQTLPAGLVAMGVFILLLSAVGAISAWKESVVGLGFYLAFLLLITIVLFSLGVAIVVQKDKAGDYIAEAWYRGPADVKNGIQQELGCCGLKFWNDSAVWPCPAVADTPEKGAYCYPQLTSAFAAAYEHAGGAGIAFSVFMGVGVAMVVCLIQGIQKASHRERANNNPHSGSNNGGGAGFSGVSGGAGYPRGASRGPQASSSGLSDPASASGGGLQDGGEAGSLVDLSEVDTNAASMFDRADRPAEAQGGRQGQQRQPSSLAQQGKRRR